MSGSSERLVRGAHGGAAPPAELRPRVTARTTLTKYMTVILVSLLGASGSALLFLVPLYADPALSSLAANFSPAPALCVTEKRDERHGLDNCTWASCREGCTSDVYRCTQIYVKYKLSEEEEQKDGILYVNIKGCGYPPVVDCDNFTATYGNVGTKFPCYWSQADPTIVVPNWSRSEQVFIVTRTLIVPLVLTIFSGIGLCALHCDCRARRRRPPRRPPRGNAPTTTGTADQTTVYRLA